MKCICDVKFVICYKNDGAIYKEVDIEEKAQKIVEKINNDPCSITGAYYYPEFTIIKKYNG